MKNPLIACVMASILSGCNITVFVEGEGTVASDDGNINCPETCSFDYPEDSRITLTAIPDNASLRFAGFFPERACDNINHLETKTCLVSTSVSKNITASFCDIALGGPTTNRLLPFIDPIELEVLACKGHLLKKNDYLESNNGRFRLVVNNEKIAVVSKSPENDAWIDELWSITPSKPGGNTLVFHEDGNLELFELNTIMAEPMVSVWSFYDEGFTTSNPPDEIILTNDGTLLMLSRNRIVWSSNSL